MQTTAREIVDRLNEYEATHTDWNNNIWNDVINWLPEYDAEATYEYRINIVVLTDGTRIDKREGEWVIA